MLTYQQSRLFDFIKERLEASRVSPSFDEMAEALGLRSKSGIFRLITALEERGFIRRLADRARSIEIINDRTEYGRGYQDGYRAALEDKAAGALQ